MPAPSPNAAERTLEEKVRLVNERITLLRQEKFARGLPFLIFLRQTPDLFYYEYADGHIDIHATKEGQDHLVETLTGAAADAIRQKAAAGL